MNYKTTILSLILSFTSYFLSTSSAQDKHSFFRAYSTLQASSIYNGTDVETSPPQQNKYFCSFYCDNTEKSYHFIVMNKNEYNFSSGSRYYYNKYDYKSKAIIYTSVHNKAESDLLQYLYVYVDRIVMVMETNDAKTIIEFKDPIEL